MNIKDNFMKLKNKLFNILFINDKKRIDIAAKLILFLSGLKEEKNKECVSSDCDRKLAYVFDSYSDFRTYFESNTNGNIDEYLLDVCTYEKTKKGTIIALKGLCDYTIGLINSRELIKVNEDKNLDVKEINELGDEQVMVMEEKMEQVSKDEFLNATEEDREFVKSQHDLLLNDRGMVLLKQIDGQKRDIIHALVKEYSDMSSFSIGEGELKYVVLRYKPYVTERLDVKEIVKLGNLAYKEGNYDACIEYYLQLLQIGKPKANIYAKIGLSYMKKKKKDIAIDYLIVANELNKEEGKDFDFDDLIASLTGGVSIEDRKPRFRMNLDEFDNPLVDNYGIENIDEITAYILDSGLDVFSACMELGMSYEQIDILRLIYARDFYYQGNDIKGDQFIKAVEMSKNKTKLTLKVLEEIRKNKKIYMNRSREKIRVLSLKLQPKKKK